MRNDARYAAGGQVVVSRTRDGGRSFEVLRESLPQRHAYDLVYRHCLDIDASGDRLTFGSTTGNPWGSEDQGERWQQISTSLPPIYCVRFCQHLAAITVQVRSCMCRTRVNPTAYLT
jgi:hypothetical protein